MKFRKLLATATIAGIAVLGLSAPAFATTHRNHCTTQLVTFNFPHGSHTLTETQGPWLRVNEVAAYHGQTYTITSVTHTGFLGHDRFTVSDTYGNPVTNSGPSIRHGEAHVLTC